MVYDGHVQKAVRVIEEKSCRRCNGRSEVRMEKTREESDAILVVEHCTKCRLRVVIGFTTERALKISNRRKKLAARLEDCDSPSMRQKIIAELARLEEIQLENELGC